VIIYIINLLLVAIFASLSGDRETRPSIKILFATFAFASMITVFTIRWGVGTDFYTYIDIYNVTNSHSLAQILQYEKEVGFHLLTWLCNMIYPGNITFYNFIIGCLAYIPVIYALRKESEQFTLSIVLYILLNLYTFAFNGMRQAVAISITFAAYPMLKNKKYLAYAILMFIAYEFHYTTLIVLPFFILVASDFKMKTKIIVEIALLFSVLFLDELWGMLMDMLEGIGQEKLVSDYDQAITSSYGVRPIRVIAALPPVICAFWRYSYVNKERDNQRHYEMYMHLSIYNVIFYVAGMQLVTLARFSAYFDIYNCMLLPMICRSFKTARERKLFTFAMLALYALMWIVLLHVDSDLLPFKFKNGTTFN